jgi:hypothetical protein
MADQRLSPAIDMKCATVGTWHIAELYSAIFIAIKPPVTTGSKWPSSLIKN